MNHTAMRRLELSKRDSSAISVSLWNRRVRQDVTSQFDGSSRSSAVAKGRLSDPDASRSVFINGYYCVNARVSPRERDSTPTSIIG